MERGFLHPASVVTSSGLDRSSEVPVSSGPFPAETQTLLALKKMSLSSIWAQPVRSPSLASTCLTKKSENSIGEPTMFSFEIQKDEPVG